jgi:hypothetical protein
VTTKPPPPRYTVSCGHYTLETGQHVAAVTVYPLPSADHAAYLAPILQRLIHDGLLRIETAGPIRPA